MSDEPRRKRGGSKKGRRIAPRLLREFRMVHKTRGEKGPEQLRDRYRNKYEWFIDRWARLEQAYLASRRAEVTKMSPQVGGTEGGPGQEAPQADPSEGRARELIHQLLEECRGEAR